MSGVQLRRINHDTSWLFTINTDSSYSTSTFNLLIDPWLDDTAQTDYHSAFSEQKRTSPALSSSIIDLEELLANETQTEYKDAKDQRKRSVQIDAILISHPFTDHMHPETLQGSSVPNRIPYMVTSDSKAGLESLFGGKKKKKKLEEEDHKRMIYLLDEANHNIAPGDKERNKILPRNVDIMQILPRERFSILSGAASIAWSKLHGGILFLWKQSNSDPDTHSLIYSPHGIASTSIPVWLQFEHFNHHHEAIITSLDKIVLPAWLSGTVNLGLSSAIQLITQDVYNARLILATHEERKEAKGIVARLIKRYWLSLEHPDAQNDGLTKLKQKDKSRQFQGQKLLNNALELYDKSAKILVLDINTPLLI